MGKAKNSGKRVAKLKERISRLRLNLWRVLTVIVFFYTLILIGHTVIKIIRTQIDIHHFESQRDEYLQSIHADSTIIEQLKHDEFLEQYARERYNMESEGETVYMFNSKNE